MDILVLSNKIFTEILKRTAFITGIGISFLSEHKKTQVGSKYIDSFSTLKNVIC